jgi:PIN domain nuclease of toxin-antitoxin system
MNILLDTCTFLWIITGDKKLSVQAREIFINPENEIYLSAVSAWEISTKHSLGRLPLPEKPEHFIPTQRKRHGIKTLLLDEESALYSARLPLLHNDPFDRMLVCQAIVNSMTIMTPDDLLSKYHVKTIW